MEPGPEENQQHLTRKLYLGRPLQGMDAIACISQQSRVNLRLTCFPGKDQALFKGTKSPDSSGCAHIPIFQISGHSFPISALILKPLSFDIRNLICILIQPLAGMRLWVWFFLSSMAISGKNFFQSRSRKFQVIYAALEPGIWSPVLLLSSPLCLLKF